MSASVEKGKVPSASHGGEKEGAELTTTLPREQHGYQNSIFVAISSSGGVSRCHVEKSGPASSLSRDGKKEGATNLVCSGQCTSSGQLVANSSHASDCLRGGCQDSMERVENNVSRIVPECLSSLRTAPLTHVWFAVRTTADDQSREESRSLRDPSANGKAATRSVAVSMCDQFFYECRHICTKGFDFTLHGREWRQVFACSRFDFFDPFTLLLLRVFFALFLLAILVWTNIGSDVPYVYFTFWTNFLATLHAVVATGCSIVALPSILNSTRDRRAQEVFGGTAPVQSVGCSVIEAGDTKDFRDSHQSQGIVVQATRKPNWLVQVFALRRRTRQAYASLQNDSGPCRDGVLDRNGASVFLPLRATSCQTTVTQPDSAVEGVFVQSALGHGASRNLPASERCTYAGCSSDCRTTWGQTHATDSPCQVDLFQEGEKPCTHNEEWKCLAGTEDREPGPEYGPRHQVECDRDQVRASGVQPEGGRATSRTMRSQGEANTSPSGSEQCLVFVLFGVWMMASVAALMCVVIFWCILVPFGQFFRSASSILEHTICLVSAFLITYTGRVPFLVYHFWVASLLSIAYCIVSVIVYTVPVTVGDKVGYVYSIFDFPAHPIQAWVSFLVVSTAGGAVAALIVWLLCWKTNVLFDPACVKVSVYPSGTLSPPPTRYHRRRENSSVSCEVMCEEQVDVH
uniref:Transmembrane protein n=1 Tax=Toxoplasma gondii (strain ATCC 50861 / VEG) TaxID=432359 RepID=A0A0F7V715_TOXGV|nr:TPA: hypothetical protein BN1205_066575 [Toxoplasma gondii VEG]